MSFDQVKDLLEAGAYGVAVAGGIGATVLFLLRHRHARRSHFELAWTGDWLNEGDVTAPRPSHYLLLELAAKDGLLSGIVTSRNLKSEAVAPNRSVTGYFAGRRGRIQVVHIRDGRAIQEAEARLRLGRAQLLEWDALHATADFYPQQASLWKHKAPEERWV